MNDYDNWKLETPPTYDIIENPCTCIFCKEEVDKTDGEEYTLTMSGDVFLCKTCDDNIFELDEDEMDMLVYRKKNIDERVRNIRERINESIQNIRNEITKNELFLKSNK